MRRDPVGTPLSRWRVGYTTVMGQSWADFGGFREAKAFALRLRRSGALDVQVMREYESDNPWAADFRDVD